MSAKKTASATKSTPKKAATRPAPTHPSWIDMIKECITASTEDSRHGVSRPHIKKYVEETYRLPIGNAQNTQLARAIATGAEKGIFVLPKGISGRVKLPPKASRAADTSASKENKPAKATAPKPTTKGRPAKTASAKATAARKPVPKPKADATGTKKTAESKAATKSAKRPASKGAPTSKAKAAAPPKKVVAGKKPASAKRVPRPPNEELLRRPSRVRLLLPRQRQQPPRSQGRRQQLRHLHPQARRLRGSEGRLLAVYTYSSFCTLVHS
ncbi:hypothetical protein EDC04DRAFT_2884549 [Pisolithus marmoratus]|nr:hypothetical protein EDC04DRAFT_2884549 [Pisolithus marmoratus]